MNIFVDSNTTIVAIVIFVALIVISFLIAILQYKKNVLINYDLKGKSIIVLDFYDGKLLLLMTFFVKF